MAFAATISPPRHPIVVVDLVEVILFPFLVFYIVGRTDSGWGGLKTKLVET
jgi:hypothetical protein